MAKAAMATPLKRAIEPQGRGAGGYLLRYPFDAYHRLDHLGRCRAAPLRRNLMAGFFPLVTPAQAGGQGNRLSAGRWIPASRGNDERRS